MLGQPKNRIVKRIRLGWNPEEAITAPVSGLYVEYRGRLHRLIRLCEQAGLPYDTILYRVHNLGWGGDRAIDTPIRGRNTESLTKQEPQ